MPRPTSAILIFVVLALAFIAACGDEAEPLSPQGVVGQYILVEAMGQEPPAVIRRGNPCTLEQGYMGDTRYTLHAGVLEFGAGGNWTLVEQLEFRCVPRTEAADTNINNTMFRHWGTYTLDGNEIELAGRREGRCILEGRRLYLFLDVWYNEHYFTYEKVDSKI